MRPCLLLSSVLASRKGGEYKISGTVSGDNPSGVTITITGDASTSTTTDGSGNYLISLPNGSYTVTPSKADHQFSPSSTNVTIAGSDQTGKNFTSSQLWDISGTIEDADGNGIPNVAVALTGDATDNTTTDSSGDYSFTDLVNGDYTVTPTSRWISPTTFCCFVSKSFSCSVIR